MQKPPIRTITLGLEDAHPLKAATITKAAHTLARTQQRFSDSGYEVQTVRLSTRPLFTDLPGKSPEVLLHYTRELQQMLNEAGVYFCSLGPIEAANPHCSLADIELLPDLLASTSSISMTVLLATNTHGLREEAALPTARAILRLAEQTPEGEGNFRFAALACVQPGTPFFPAAYHEGPSNLSLGLQGASIIAETARKAQEAHQQSKPTLAQITSTVKIAIEEQASPIVALGKEIATAEQVNFGGIDLSPAPLGEDSIVSAIEAFGYGTLGSPGMVALIAALTRALKITDLPTCGYCGIMLPVLEDAMLGKCWEKGQISIHELLLYSTICGTGLDTIPLPGDIQESSLAQLLLDVATLAWRLRKPLSARLFPIPGKSAGAYTTFISPYLTNTVVR